MVNRFVAKLVATAAAAALAGAALTLLPATASAHPSDVDFTGTVKLDDCSGSVVRPAGAGPNDPAMVLTNGHCYEGGFLDPGQVIVNQPSSRTFDLLSPDGQSTLGTLQASQVLYATMTDTDVTIYQLALTYQQIQDQYGITALTLSATHPVQGDPISVVSGYWQQIYSCSIDGFVYQLHENNWVWKDSVRYTEPGCEVIGGTSGSPVIDQTTGQVVAINNTINENGESCTLDNPCEVDQNGNVTIHQNVGYAQETYLINACVDTGNVINLNLSGCTLPKPTS